MARLFFADTLARVSPPWLQRTIGGAVMHGLGDPIDAQLDRLVEGVKLRFPNVVSAESLPLLGRQRRIKRGPAEAAATYAARLRIWWDSHRARGGAYALLEQLRAYLAGLLEVRMDVVYHSGTRRWMDTDGVVTRDAITWGADGTSDWAQVWIFFHLAEAPAAQLITLDGFDLATLDGDPLITLDGADLFGLGVSTAAEILEAIPREWSAAHVLRTHIVLLWPEVELWEYPEDLTWTDDALTVWPADEPMVIVVEG